MGTHNNTVKLVLDNVDKCKTKEDLINIIRKTRKVGRAKAVQWLEQAYEASIEVRKKVDALVGVTNPFVEGETQKTSKVPVKQKSVDEVVRENKALKEFKDNVSEYIKEHLAPMIKKISLPKLEELNITPVSVVDRAFILVLNDTHIGSACKKEQNTKNVEWNSEIALESINYVVDQAIYELESDKRNFDKVIVAWGGDLFHTLTGTTQKGTRLECELNGPEQFKKTLDMMTKVVFKLLSTGRKVENYFVHGNHDGITGQCLGYAAKMIFDTNTQYNDLVSWKVSMNDSVFFEANDTTLVCLHHGASAKTDFKFTVGPSKANETRAGNLFQMYEDTCPKKYKSRIIIVGDKHHFSCHEYARFVMIQAGSIVKADHYADDMILNARPQQTIVTVNNKGFESAKVIYTD